MKTVEKNREKTKVYLVVLFWMISICVNATTYTMGTTGSQSATITAISGSPDKFYDNGGSGGNYSSSIASVTYTFNCAAGKYVRLKFNSLVTESSFDYIYLYDGATTSDRLIGQSSFSGTASAFMCVATSGSITVKFTSDGSNVYAGWDADVWIDDSPGQKWLGGTSTNTATASNWEGSLLPSSYHLSSIYVPSGTTYSPDHGSSSGSLTFFDFRVASGATFTYSSTSTSNGIIIYGDLILDGTFSHSGSIYVQLEGGTSSTFAQVGGAGSFNTLAFEVGLNRLAYYKLKNSIVIQEVNLVNTNGNAKFDMNDFDLTTYYTTVGSSTTFYQRSGTLRIEQNAASINDAAFNENTGTTYFSKGTSWAAGSQTIPSITYYNLQVRTNNGYTATIGSGSTVTVTNDLTILNPGTLGGIATNTNNDVTVGNNLFIGNSGNGLTLNLVNRLYRASGTGTLTMGNVSDHAVNVTYASSANYVISGFGTPTFYGTFTYNAASAQKVIPATYFNFISTGTGTKTLYGTVDINGDITLSNGTLSQSTYDMTVAGNWTSTGNYFGEGTGTVTFDGTGTSTITGTSASIGGSTGNVLFTEDFESAWTTCSYPNSWASDRTCGGSDDAGYSAAWHRNDNTGNNWNYTSSGAYSPTYQSGAYSARFHSYGVHSSVTAYLETPSINLSAYTNCQLTFYYQNTDGSDGLDVQFYNGSSWSSAATYTTQSGWGQKTISIGTSYQINGFKIRFKATSDYGNTDIGLDYVAVTGDIAGSAFTGEAFNKLGINKSGAGYVSMSSNVAAESTLTFTSGMLKTTGYTIVLGTSTANGAISGAGSSAYIVAYDNSGTIGSVKQYINTAAGTVYSFPIGDATNYTPLTFTLTSGVLASAYVTVYTKAVKVPGLNSSNTKYINRYWDVVQSGVTSPSYSVSYVYVDGDIVGGTETGMLPVKRSGSTWYKPTGSSFLTGTAQGTGSVNATTNTLTWTGLSTFSDFGGAVDAPVALPIELISFTGKKDGQNNRLDWLTVSELNSDLFIIEKTNDGESFEVVGELDGAGNSNSSVEYMLVDKNVKETINYYRLKHVDFDGNITISNMISIDNRKNFSVKVVVKVTNILGQDVNEYYKGVVIILYSDGTSIKMIQ